MNYKFIAYAADFVSFLLEKLSETNVVANQIVLFGSVARLEASKESDVDIFVDVMTEKDEQQILQIRDAFYDSVKFKRYWKLLGVENEINCIVGNINKIGDLKRSLIQNGTVLYGSFKGQPKTELHNLFIVTPSKNRNRNISAWRALYGYKQRIGNKTYTNKGLLNNFGGQKLSRGVFVVPALHTPKIILFLKQNKFEYKILPFWKEKN
ncbi:nucleotidyltransferase domain-containing protein [Candidatus Woesearchaeota archaeon]|nr:nucleotidyltransferase domain-containing protein [Candidatus Woesearchaeota archaeon]